MAKKSQTSGKKEPVDPFALLQMAFDIRRQKEKEQRWAAMSEAERHEYRGSVMATGSFWKCLGPPAEEFAGDDYLERVQEALLDCIENGENEGGPRPLVFANGGWGVCHERLVKKKYFASTCSMRLPIAWIANDGVVSVIDSVREPRHSLNCSHIANAFMVCLGIGLFSDMAFSAVVGEYAYLYPEWEGIYFHCKSPALSLDEPGNIDLRVQLPFRGGLPEGLHLVGSISITFYHLMDGNLGQCGGGGMTVRLIEQQKVF